MVIADSKTMTLQAFLECPDLEESPAWEYLNGEKVRKPMGGGKHSTLQKRLVGAIDAVGSSYEAFPKLRCTFGDRSVVPDVTVVEIARIPLDDFGEIASTGIEFAPDWVIEILSPNQSQTRVTGNILHCLRNGSRLGWLLDADERSILVFQPDRLPDLLIGTDELPVLAGINLNLSVDEVFSWLRRRR